MINLTCPHCRLSISVPDDNAGKKAACPQCGQMVDVPAAPTFFEAAPPPGPEPASHPPPSGLPPFTVEPEISSEPGRDRPWTQPPGPSVLDRPPMEFAILSFVLGGVALVTSPLIILTRTPGVFPPIMLGLAVLFLAGLGLTLSIFGMIRTMALRLDGFWYVLSALVLSGLAVICGLTMFIATLTIPSAAAHGTP